MQGAGCLNGYDHIGRHFDGVRSWYYTYVDAVMPTTSRPSHSRLAIANAFRKTLDKPEPLPFSDELAEAIADCPSVL